MSYFVDWKRQSDDTKEEGNYIPPHTNLIFFLTDPDNWLPPAATEEDRLIRLAEFRKRYQERMKFDLFGETVH